MTSLPPHPQPSTRYLCGWCPDVDITDGRDRPDDEEVLCPSCGDVMTRFDAYECPICLDWAAAEDAIRFMFSHDHFAPVPAGNGRGVCPSR